MFEHFTMILLTGAVFINTRAASVSFCNKTEVLHHENSTSVCVAAGSLGEENIFRKCCPPNFAYDTQTHACKFVGVNRHFLDFPYYDVGLRRCLHDFVVVDYVMDVKDFEITDGRVESKDGHRFEAGRYCLDEVYNQSKLVVLRGCENSARSCGGGGIRCLRKCCPDLEIYVNGAKCLPSADFVFDYKNWSKGTQVTSNGMR